MVKHAFEKRVNIMIPFHCKHTQRERDWERLASHHHVYGPAESSRSNSSDPKKSARRVKCQLLPIIYYDEIERKTERETERERPRETERDREIERERKKDVYEGKREVASPRWRLTMAKEKKLKNVRKHITSKRIELGSPSCSGFEETLKGFKTWPTGTF